MKHHLPVSFRSISRSSIRALPVKKTSIREPAGHTASKLVSSVKRQTTADADLHQALTILRKLVPRDRGRPRTKPQTRPRSQSRSQSRAHSPSRQSQDVRDGTQLRSYFSTSPAHRTSGTGGRIAAPRSGDGPGAKGQGGTPAGGETDFSAETWKQLDFESDVFPIKTSSHDETARLVDLPANRDDVTLWARLLRFRWRVYGASGVRDVWKGIRARKVLLPSDGSTIGVGVDAEAEHNAFKECVDDDHVDATYVWTLLLTWAPLDEILEYAFELKARNSIVYSPLYELAMERMLEPSVFVADAMKRADGRNLKLEHMMSLHARFERDYVIPSTALSRLALRLSAQGRESAVSQLRSFTLVLLGYRLQSESGEWPDMAVSVWGGRGANFSPADRTEISRVLIRAGLAAEERGWAHLFSRMADSNTPMAGAVTQAVKPGWMNTPTAVTTDSQATPNPDKKANTNGKKKSQSKIDPDLLSDDLLTRLFATRALSLQTIFSGLGMLVPGGRLGPASIRELARRCGDPDRFRTGLDGLSRAGIGLQSSVVTDALIRFSRPASGAADMFRRMCQDGHSVSLFVPGQIDRVVESDLRAGDVDMAVVSLAIFAVSVGEADPVTAAWNAVLAFQAGARRVTSTLAIVDLMLALRVPVQAAAATELATCLLGPRVGEPGTRDEAIRLPPNEPDGPIEAAGAAEADAKLLVRTWQRILVSQGGGVDPAGWRLVLVRLGGLGCWDDLVATSIWLADWYSCRTCRVDAAWGSDHRQATDGRGHLDLNALFPPKVQQAILVWGFRRGWRKSLTAEEAAAITESVEVEDAGVDSDASVGPKIESEYPEWDLIAQLEADRRQVESSVDTASDSTLPASSPFSKPWSMAAGLDVLQSLASRGVSLNFTAIDRTIRRVLWTMYGAGVSSRSLNRLSRVRIAPKVQLEEVLHDIGRSLRRLPGYRQQFHHWKENLSLPVRPNSMTDGLGSTATDESAEDDSNADFNEEREWSYVSSPAFAIATSSRPGRLIPKSENGYILEPASPLDVRVPYASILASRLVQETTWRARRIDRKYILTGKGEGEEADGGVVHAIPDGAVERMRKRMVRALWGDLPRVSANPQPLVCVSGVDGRPLEAVYPAPRPRTRIPPAIWARALDRWAVDGVGTLDQVVELELRG